MCALGTQAQRSHLGGPNYPVPCVYVKVCQGNILCHCVMDVMCAHLPYVVYMNAAIEYQGHLHHHSLSHAHVHTLFMPPVVGDTGGNNRMGYIYSTALCLYSDLSEYLSWWCAFICHFFSFFLSLPLPHLAFPYFYIKAMFVFELCVFITISIDTTFH